MAKNKYIETPEKMWELFTEYRNDIRENPIQIVEQSKTRITVPKDFEGDISSLALVKLPAQRPLTMEGFENFVADKGLNHQLSQYFANTGGAYSDYKDVCKRIKRVIRQDQIEGGMAGIYSQSITARLNGLVDKVESKVDYTSDGKAIDLSGFTKEEKIKILEASRASREE